MVPIVKISKKRADQNITRVPIKIMKKVTLHRASKKVKINSKPMIAQIKERTRNKKIERRTIPN
jgi:hypothetical protein